MNPWLERLAGFALRGRHADERHLTCGHAALAHLQPTLSLRSRSLGRHGEMQLAHAGPGVGANRSPALSWSLLPARAAGWALVMEDPDVPLRRPFLHLVAFGPASIVGLDEGALGRESRPEGVWLAPNGRGQAAYLGPRPLPGHGPHRYVFQLFALDVPPSHLPHLAWADWVAKHTVAWGRMDGVFQRDPMGRPIPPDILQPRESSS